MKLNISKIFNIAGTLLTLVAIIWSICEKEYGYLWYGIVLLIINMVQIKSVWNLNKKAM